MGWFGDLLFGKQQGPQYLGGPELGESYKKMAGIEAPDYSGYQTDIRNFMGQLGGEGLTSAVKDYMTRSMEGQNVYESDAFKKFEEATLAGTRERLGGLASQLGGSGLLRGSGSERMAGDVIGQAQQQLGQQAFTAQQAGLQRQYGMAQYIPQLQLQGTQMGAGLEQMGFAGQLQQAMSQSQIAQAINEAYGYKKKSGGLLGAAGSLLGLSTGTIGGTLLGSIFGGN